MNLLIFDVMSHPVQPQGYESVHGRGRDGTGRAIGPD